MPEADAEQRRAAAGALDARARRARARAGRASPRGTRRRRGGRAPSAARSASWSAVSDRRGRRRARAPSRPSGGCPSRSRRPRSSDHARERPLGARHAGLGRVDRHRGAQRAGERLEGRLDHVVGVGAGLDVDVQRQLRAALATARKNSSASSWSKPPIAAGRQRRPRSAQYGRPEMSIAHAARASSIGTVAWP